LNLAIPLYNMKNAHKSIGTQIKNKYFASSNPHTPLWRVGEKTPSACHMNTGMGIWAL
jgi:hypothetical protein